MLDGLNIRLDVIFVSGFIFTSVTVDAGKFPTLVTHQESLEAKVNETKAVVKFQLKKVLCMGVAVGNCSMEEKQVFQNVQLSVNFLVSLLKKSWQNVISLIPVSILNHLTCENDVLHLQCLSFDNYHIWNHRFLIFVCLVYVTTGKMFAPEEYHGKTTTHILKITGFSGTWKQFWTRCRTFFSIGFRFCSHSRFFCCWTGTTFQNFFFSNLSISYTSFFYNALLYDFVADKLLLEIPELTLVEKFLCQFVGS